MEPDNSEFETRPDASSTISQMDTPPSEQDSSPYWTDREDVPWPESTFQIIEKGSRRAITLAGDQLKLLSAVNEPSHWDTHWLCVKQNGYFGFQNPMTGKYLGHDGKGRVYAVEGRLRNWELFSPRMHPDGGYELLSPYYSGELMVLCVGEDGRKLVRRRHGTTLWEFIRVST